MSEVVSQESALPIDDIARRFKQLERDRTEARELVQSLSDKLTAAKAAEAKVARRFAKISKLIAALDEDDEDDSSVEHVIEAEADTEEEAPKVFTPKVLPKPNGTAITRPSAKRANLTVPEKVAAVMGDAVWDAAGLEKVLAAEGIDFKSNNLRAYVSSILSSTKMFVPGQEDLLGSDGKPLRVHRFTQMERGKYRVANAEDIQEELRDLQREARKTLGANEVIISENGSNTPADELFAEQGIDIRSAITPPPQQH